MGMRARGASGTRLSVTDRASFSWRWSGRCRARSAAEATALVAILVTALASSSALAAAPQYCVLWAREAIRISLISTTDIDLITATPELIRRMFDRRYAWCISQKAEYLGLPGGDKRLTDAWVAFMAERIIGKRQPEPEPAGDASDTVVDAPEREVANEASKQAAASGPRQPNERERLPDRITRSIWIGAALNTALGMKRRAP